VFLRYWVAQFGPYYNFMGWSPIWECPEVWTYAQVNQITSYAQSINPFRTMLSVHDCSDSHLSAGLTFPSAELRAQAFFVNNNRLGGDRILPCEPRVAAWASL